MAMIINKLRKRLRILSYKRKYPQSDIAVGSFVSDDSILGSNVRIGRNTNIICSILASNVNISTNCQVSNTVVGDNVAVSPTCNILSSSIDGDCRVNQGCSLSESHMGQYSYVAETSKISKTNIGRFCSIGPYLVCGYGDHPTDFVSTSPAFFSTLKQCGCTFTERDCFEERREINIGNDVWIGAGVFIRDGVRIGNGAIIGAGAVIVKDVPDYAIVGGVPAQVIRFRFADDIIEKLLDIEWWNWSKERLRKAQALFAQDNIYLFIEWAQQEFPG